MKSRLIALFALFAALPLFAAGTQLKFVVIVSRHGVRSPTWDAARLREYSSEPWPEWGVPPGYLTPHGREAMLKMGAYYRDWLASEHLLNTKGCESSKQITIYADKDQRTIETGRALAEALLPGCGLTTRFQPGGKSDPLFSGTLTTDLKIALQAVRDRLQPGLVERHKTAFEALERVLGSPRFMVPHEVAAILTGNIVEMEGPFAIGSTLSEDLLLEYTNGMRGKDLGWGRLNKPILFQTLEIHSVYTELMRRTPYLARARGSNLLEHILRSMEQAVTGAPVAGALGRAGDAALILSGHDTNLSNLSGMLDLSWRLPDYQPDDTPPGGALLFLLSRDGSGQYVVRMRYVAQTPDQMRNLDALSMEHAPASQDLSVADCAASPAAGCPWNIFRSAAEKRLTH